MLADCSVIDLPCDYFARIRQLEDQSVGSATNDNVRAISIAADTAFFFPSRRFVTHGYNHSAANAAINRQCPQDPRQKICVIECFAKIANVLLVSG